MIKILITSDLHGRLDCFVPLLEQMKNQKADLVIDNGDFLDGSPATFYYKQINQQLHPMISLANELYDVAIFGNHDLNDSISSIETFRKSFQFPWISCNIGDFAPPYFTKVIHGKKFIVIGATTHFTPLWYEHTYSKQLTFQSTIEALRFWVAYVKEHEQPDYLIVSYHGGFSEDPVRHSIYQERIGENQGNEILEEIKDIDLLITGHQHLYFNETIDNTLVIQPTSHGKGFMEIQVDFKDDHKQSSATYHQLPSENNYLYPVEVERWLDEEITSIDEDYTYQGLLNSRLTSHPYIQLIHDMQLKVTKADLSVFDLNYLDCGGFKNIITHRDLLRNAPREHKLRVILLTGLEIKSLLEQSAKVFAINKNGELDFSTNVHRDIPQPYQYDFWGGLSYIFDISKPGAKVSEVTFKGRPLNDHHSYRVVMNSYRLTGYDFPLLKNRKVLYESTTSFPFLLKNYLQQSFPTQVPNHGQFKIIY